ncbi:MAG: YcnI family protein [Burkholderiales bacterium]
MHNKGIWLAVVLCLPAQGMAHVVLEQPKATAGAYYKAVFRMSHGCEGAATNRVTVLLPEGIQAAKPMVKPGWTVTTRRAALAKPYVLHGRTIAEDVVEIAWSGGPLASEHYDEFAIMLKLPETPGRAYFRVLQACEQGQMDWVEVPGPGKPVRALRYPAPALQIEPAPRGHAHHH